MLSVPASSVADGERLAIHMAFDCMAIAVGLIASVMATWPANERFTYGYGRIETLSGFANGIFLILISIFIVFEAIQRMFVASCLFFLMPRGANSLSSSLDPPEMNTNQLLLVSSLGLGVNLFGMFAMGGHHHHVCMMFSTDFNLLTCGVGAFALAWWPQPRTWTFSCTTLAQALRKGERVYLRR